jgi:hypothetical protein
VNRYVLEIDGEKGEREFFVDALHDCFNAVQQGAKRVVMTRIKDGEVLCVFTPPQEESS